ncbi:hypothetical protein PENSPDRAFT_264166 [Peniophora sp. CONT]|nr:hypothetical protein PENSPDRAFT_264166 [Peniophora sp. CONT]
MPLLSQPVVIPVHPFSAPAAITFPRSSPPQQRSTNIRVAPSTPDGFLYQYRQKTAKNLILSECQGALYQFTVDALLTAPFANPLSSRSFSKKETLVLAPTFSAKEDENYAPMADWLNDITEQTGRGDQFTCYVYDRLVAGDDGDLKYSLKPDIFAGFFGHPVTEGIKLFWRDPGMPGELKAKPTECLSQALTYAAKILGTELRWWCPVLVFDHQTKIARMAFCTRAGVFISEKLKLPEPDQRLRFVRLLRWYVQLEPEEAGYDRSTRHDGEKLFFALPNATAAEGFDWWEVEEVLCNTLSLRGRATSVYRLRCIPQASTGFDSAAEDVDDQMSNLHLGDASPGPSPDSGTHGETGRVYSNMKLRDLTPTPTSRSRALLLICGQLNQCSAHTETSPLASDEHSTLVINQESRSLLHGQRHAAGLHAP